MNYYKRKISFHLIKKFAYIYLIIYKLIKKLVAITKKIIQPFSKTGKKIPISFSWILETILSVIVASAVVFIAVNTFTEDPTLDQFTIIIGKIILAFVSLTNSFMEELGLLFLIFVFFLVVINFFLSSKSKDILTNLFFSVISFDDPTFYIKSMIFFSIYDQKRREMMFEEFIEDVIGKQWVNSDPYLEVLSIWNNIFNKKTRFDN